MSKKKPGAYVCQKCQHPTSQLMQAASPFYTCPVEACAFYIRIGCAPSKGAEAVNGDSVGKVVAEMHAINDSPELCALYDRLESLDRQHREEVARHEAFASQAVLDMRRKDGLIEAAEAALGEARDALYEAWEFFAHYSSINEPAQDDMAEEKNEMLNKMLTASNWKPQP